MAYSVSIQANLVGGAEVEAGFNNMAAAAESMGTRVATSSNAMTLSYRTMSLQMAGLMMNSMQLTDVMDRMSKGQMDLSRGAIIAGINILQLAANVWMLSKACWADVAAGVAELGTWLAKKIAIAAATIAEGAYAVAAFIANGVASVGAAVPAMIAAIAASAVIGAYLVKPMASGGIVTRPTYALLGESGPELVTPLSGGRGMNNVTINIHQAVSASMAADAVIDALRRFGVI